MKRRRNLRRWIGLLILFISLALLVWGFLPFGRLTNILPITPSDMQLPTPGAWIPVLPYVLRVVWI